MGKEAEGREKSRPGRKWIWVLEEWVPCLFVGLKKMPVSLAGIEQENSRALAQVSSGRIGALHTHLLDQQKVPKSQHNLMDMDPCQDSN